MSASKCERCGFTDWVIATQCKQCGAQLDSEDAAPGLCAVTNSAGRKSFSKFGAALSSLYLLIVILIVSQSFTCGRVGGDRWPAISYCLLLTLTICSFPWPFILGFVLNLFGITPTLDYDFLVFPVLILGVAANVLLLYKFGKAVSRGVGGGHR